MCVYVYTHVRSPFPDYRLTKGRPEEQGPFNCPTITEQAIDGPGK